MKQKGELFVKDNLGNKVNIPYRHDFCTLNSKQLLFFYKNFVVRCENDIKKLKYFFINSKEIKALKKNEKIDIVPFENKEQKEIINIPNVFYFLMKPKIATIPSLLLHIRNAFAHNRIHLHTSGEIELFDVDIPRHMNKKDLDKLKKKGEKRPKPRITMYSKFSSFNKLEKVILGIINTQQ